MEQGMIRLVDQAKDSEIALKPEIQGAPKVPRDCC